MSGSNVESQPRVVSQKEWLVARKALLKREKELTRLKDEINASRRELPWVKVEKEYVFEAPEGKVRLADLFDGRSQLFVQHFMFAPGWKEGCVGCSFEADHVDGARQHFEQNDLSFVAISRAPLAELEAFKKRMGWRFKWVSSFGSDFNYDYQASFKPDVVASGKCYYNFQEQDFAMEEIDGSSVFAKDADGVVYHTNSVYARGNESIIGAYAYLDFAPKGRNENGPRFNLTDWVRHHDRYGHAGTVGPTGRYIPSETSGCCTAGEQK